MVYNKASVRVQVDTVSSNVQMSGVVQSMTLASGGLEEESPQVSGSPRSPANRATPVDLHVAVDTSVANA